MKLENLTDLSKKIIDGFRLSKDDDVSLLLNAPTDEVCAVAGDLQKHFAGKHVDLCTIINARCGRCSEDCKYCAQSSSYHTECEEYPFISTDEIVANARANEAAGVNRVALVTSGRALSGREFDKAIEAYEKIHNTMSIGLCGSLGLLSRQQLRRLREAGVTFYHHNIETSRRFFPEVCTTHTYDDRIRTIRMAQEEGLGVCSGGIIGLGENWDDRLDMAFDLQGLGIRSIPINILTPIKGTPLESQPPLSVNDILRTIAIFRIINPEANVRMAAGRRLLTDNGAEAFQGGASAAITGNMLTTTGTTVSSDVEMLTRLGLSNK